MVVLFGTHFLRLQTEGAIEPLNNDLALLQGGRARLLGGAAVDAERLQRGDQRPLLADFSLHLPGTSHPEAPSTHGRKQSMRERTSGATATAETLTVGYRNVSCHKVSPLCCLLQHHSVLQRLLLGDSASMSPHALSRMLGAVLPAPWWREHQTAASHWGMK